MSDGQERFVWHPVWRGRTVDEVRAELRERAGRDQRAYALALEGAERHENDALSSVVALERTWGGIALDWPEADPDALAEAMLAAERERERRRELTPMAELRDLLPRPGSAPAGDDLPEKSIRLTDPTARLAVLLVVFVLVALFVWRLLGG
ncbi:MAG TPA: hypothetical protein VER37_06865 [Thermomicrobiales bacterium]|nr:hypothetical protein [Thermomicrobiales bacterium]